MSGTLLFEYDFGSNLYKKTGNHRVFRKIDGWVVRAQMNDDLFKLLKKNHDDVLIAQIVRDKGKKACEETEKKLEVLINGLVADYKRSKKFVAVESIRQEWYTKIDAELKTVKTKVQGLPLAQWNKLLTSSPRRK